MLKSIQLLVIEMCEFVHDLEKIYLAIGRLNLCIAI